MEDEATLSTAAKWIVVIFLGGLVIGGIILAWVNILGPAFNQASYNLYNDSPQHLQAVAQRFSDDCLQIAGTKDTTARKALEQDIYQVSATVHVDKVEMPDVTRACVTQAIYDATHQ